MAFAKPMAPDLGFSEAVYGAGAGIFFWATFCSRSRLLIVERWSARLWTSRILITWGICAVLMSFVKNRERFYSPAFAGLGERDFSRRHIYLTHCSRYRIGPRAGGLILAVPISFVIGARSPPVPFKLVWIARLALVIHPARPAGNCLRTDHAVLFD